MERLYSEGRWSEAEAAGQALLAMLDQLAAPLAHNQATDPGVWALWRERALLVQGHTQLYGLADPAAAAALYQQVLELGSDPMLCDIASAGLAQCQSVSAPEPPPARPDATPWLTENNPGHGLETPFAGFVQPVQIAETAKTELLPQPLVGEQRQEHLKEHPQQHPEQQLEEHPEQQLDVHREMHRDEQLEEPNQDPSSQPLSPEDQAELALGLLRVVIQAN